MTFGPIPIDPPLTAEEVAALPEGEEVIVVWSGGNGPHRYTVHIEAGDLYAGHPRNDNPLTGMTAFVGQERYHTRVWRAHPEHVIRLGKGR